MNASKEVHMHARTCHVLQDVPRRCLYLYILLVLGRLSRRLCMLVIATLPRYIRGTAFVAAGGRPVAAGVIRSQ